VLCGEMSKSDKKTSDKAKNGRDEKLKAALRANLQRRKQKARILKRDESSNQVDD
jgi:hypothetical protein